jgi:hypothetical protein
MYITYIGSFGINGRFGGRGEGVGIAILRPPP